MLQLQLNVMAMLLIESQLIQHLCDLKVIKKFAQFMYNIYVFMYILYSYL